MSHSIKQPFDFHRDRIGLFSEEAGVGKSMVNILTHNNSLQQQIGDAIDRQIRLIASQTGSRGSARSLSSGGESSNTILDCNESNSEKTEVQLGKNSGITSDTYGEEHGIPEVEYNLEGLESSYGDTCGDEKRLGNKENKSEITLPSYTEMCGDEESLVQLDDRTDGRDDAFDTVGSITGLELDQERTTKMPGCFGDCMVGNMLPQDVRLPKASSLKNYRYIGKRRPNCKEFEDTPNWRDVARIPPVESTATDFETLIKRWLSESEGKAENERADLRFHDESNVRQTCRDILPRLSSSSVELSSLECKTRKRKMSDYGKEVEYEATLSSRSETDISRPLPRRPIKRRKK